MHGHMNVKITDGLATKSGLESSRYITWQIFIT